MCQDGFDRHENGRCVLDPCHSDNSVCSRFATCDKSSQADGSFSSSCTCREGTVGDGVDCVADKCYNGKLEKQLVQKYMKQNMCFNLEDKSIHERIFHYEIFRILKTTISDHFYRFLNLK